MKGNCYDIIKLPTCLTHYTCKCSFGKKSFWWGFYVALHEVLLLSSKAFQFHGNDDVCKMPICGYTTIRHPFVGLRRAWPTSYWVILMKSYSISLIWYLIRGFREAIIAKGIHHEITMWQAKRLLWKSQVEKLSWGNPKLKQTLGFRKSWFEELLPLSLDMIRPVCACHHNYTQMIYKGIGLITPN